MYNITQAVKLIALGKFPFCNFNGIDNAKAKTGIWINGDFHFQGYGWQSYKEESMIRREFGLPE
jgi:hypothetical protein